MIPEGTPDPEVLRIAAAAGRVLVSRDVTTMPDHFEKFVSSNSSPGLLLISARRSIQAVIEGLLIVWLYWPEDALRGQIRWIPHPDQY